MARKAQEKTETKTDSGNIRAAKSQALEVALASIEKQFGKGSIMKYSADAKMDVEVIPTGSFALDLALGVGGCCAGCIDIFTNLFLQIFI